MSSINLKSFNAAIAKMTSPKDLEFANSLAEQWDRKGYLSEKQLHWVGVLFERANKPATPVAPTKPAVDLTPIFAMFGTAKSNGMKAPRVRMRADEVEVVVSPAGASSSNPGALYVKVGGEYAGKITPAGEMRLLNHIDASVGDAIVAMAADPAGAALSYGRKTGNCCFCGLLLTDERSVTAGYGPVCAEHYGLDWG